MMLNMLPGGTRGAPAGELICLSTIQDRFPSIILNVSKISAKTALSLREKVHFEQSRSN